MSQQRGTGAEWLKFLKKIDRKTPKASWLNMVEWYFCDIITERLCRSVFTSVPEPWWSTQ